MAGGSNKAYAVASASSADEPDSASDAAPDEDIDDWTPPEDVTQEAAAELEGQLAEVKQRKALESLVAEDLRKQIQNAAQDPRRRREAAR